MYILALRSGGLGVYVDVFPKIRDMGGSVIMWHEFYLCPFIR